jgi:hypothetical protein
MKRACVAILAAAVASLAVWAPAPGYDAWSWLLWGREVAHGGLSTVDGPAFKPLPGGVCALLAPFGGAAPWLWVLIVRAAAVAALVLAFRLGRELAAPAPRAASQGVPRAAAPGGGRSWRPAAGGVLAAAAVGLTGGFASQAAIGGEAPLVVAFALGGLELWRAGRLRAALLCAVACALLRVEAWPFLAAVGFLAWRSGERGAVLALAVVPALWFFPEWLGSGDPLRSGARARVPNPGQPALADVPALASLEAAARIAVWPLLIGALFVRDRLVLAAGTAWVALVALMAEAGFSGEPRYALPGVALATAAGAAGLASTSNRPLVNRGSSTLTTVSVANVEPPPLAPGQFDVDATPTQPNQRGAARALLVALVVAALVIAAPHVAELAHIRAAQAHQWALANDLNRAVTAAGGTRAVLACGRPYVGRYRGPLMAYALDVTKRAVEPDEPPRPPGFVFRARLTAAAAPAPSAPPDFEDVAHAGEWEVLARCN